MKKKTRAYYFPFDGGAAAYSKAYMHLNRTSRMMEITELKSPAQILSLPFGALVIVEAISSIRWHFFVRLDLKILHTPRGGASLKLGWKSLGRLKWHVQLRLARRSHVLFRNSYISRYYGFEESFSQKKALVGCEVIDDYLSTLPARKNTIQISLSECWAGSELVEFVRQVSTDLRFVDATVHISIHPSVSLSAIELEFLKPYLKDFGSEFIPEIYITDCVSTVFLADSLNLTIYVVRDQQSPDRALIIPQESIFCLDSSALQPPFINQGHKLVRYLAGSSPILSTVKANSFENLLCRLISR